MTDRYHINPATHRSNKCSAKVKCRFGLDADEHYTKTEAETVVESRLNAVHQPLSSLRKPRGRKSLFSKPAQPVDFTPSGLPIFSELALREALNHPAEEKLAMFIARARKNTYTPAELKRAELRGEELPVYTSYRYLTEVGVNAADDLTQMVFTKGACLAFAGLAHRATGLPLQEWHYPEYEFWSGHAALKLGEDAFLDITGLNSHGYAIASFAGHKTFVASEGTLDELEESQALYGRGGFEKFYANLSELDRGLLSRYVLQVFQEAGLVATP